MAIYSTYFVCRPDELTAGFPDWKPPLLQPVWREIYNPFTGKQQMVHTREPAWPDPSQPISKTSSDPISKGRRANLGVLLRGLVARFRLRPTHASKAGVVTVTGDYDEYLESRLLHFVRARPHECSKGITNVELGAIVRSAKLDVEVDMPLYAPPDYSAALIQIPADLVATLRRSDEGALEEIAYRLADELSTPDFTHSMTGVRLNDGSSTEYAADFLVQPLVALASKMTEDQRMYLLVEA